MVENRCEMSIVPVEVKAETNTRAKSLINYCRKYTPPVAVRCSMNDYSLSQLPTSDETAIYVSFDGKKTEIIPLR